MRPIKLAFIRVITRFFIMYRCPFCGLTHTVGHKEVYKKAQWYGEYTLSLCTQEEILLLYGRVYEKRKNKEGFFQLVKVSTEMLSEAFKEWKCWILEQK